MAKKKAEMESNPEEISRKRGRKSEILSTGLDSFDTNDLEDSYIQDYNEFADELTRKLNQDRGNSSDETETSSDDESDLGEEGGFFSQRVVLFGVVLPIILGILSACLLSSYSGVPPDVGSPIKMQPKKEGKAPVVRETKQNADWRKDLKEKGSQYRVLTDDEIKYVQGGPLYLVIAGHVFDVTSGGKMYEEGSGYHGFVGKDGSRAFVTGKFDEEGLTPDLKGLTPEDFKGISGWINFYLNHEKYKFVGILKGWFFDEKGNPTDNLKELMENEDIAIKKEKAQAKVEEQFPTCNIEWTADKGSRLWCSNNSGGVQRTWQGVPRVFTDGEDSAPRCACVNSKDLQDSRLSEYKGCPPKSYECHIKDK